ncbi:IS3 family transposase [Streptomyces sp. NPDC055709]
MYRSRPEATIKSVVTDLGVNTESLRNWIRAAPGRRSGSHSAPLAAVPGGHTAQEELAAARKRIRELEEERDILCKAAQYLAAETCAAPRPRGRLDRPVEAELADRIRKVHQESNGTYRAARITAAPRDEGGLVINHKRVARIMRTIGLEGVVCVAGTCQCSRRIDPRGLVQSRCVRLSLARGSCRWRVRWESSVGVKTSAWWWRSIMAAVTPHHGALGLAVGDLPLQAEPPRIPLGISSRPGPGRRDLSSRRR